MEVLAKKASAAEVIKDLDILIYDDEPAHWPSVRTHVISTRILPVAHVFLSQVYTRDGGYAVRKTVIF